MSGVLCCTRFRPPCTSARQTTHADQCPRRRSTALLRNRVYIAQIDAPDYGVSTRREFEPLSERVFYRVQAILDGRLTIAVPQLRDHLGLRGFRAMCGVRRSCAFAGRLPEMPFRKRATRTGFQVSFELHGAFLICKFHSSDKSPRSPGRRMRRQSSIVRHDSFGDVRCQTRVVASRDLFALKNVDDVLFYRTAGRSAKQEPFSSL